MSTTISSAASGTPISALSLLVTLTNTAAGNITLATWTQSTDVVASGTVTNGTAILPATFLAELQRRVTNVITPNVASGDLTLVDQALTALLNVADLTGTVALRGSISAGVVSAVLENFVANQAAYISISLPPDPGNPFVTNVTIT